MRKIMLVIDDFKELVSLESLLRRLGFDVLSLGKDLLVNDALLRFSPDLVIATGRGRAVDGIRLSIRLRKTNPAPRVILGYAAGQSSEIPAEAQTTVDATIDFPVQPTAIIKLISQLSGSLPGPLLTKYEKLMGGREVSNEAQFVSGRDESGRPTSVIVTGGAGTKRKPEVVKSDWDPAKTPGLAGVARSERSDRYEKFLKDNDVGEVKGVLPKAKAMAAMEKLKKDAQGERKSLDSIDADKREFAKALFKSGRGTGGTEA